MDKQVQNDCQKILKQLLKNPDANPFRTPVNYKELQLYDYPNIVKNPMDLGTIEANLKAKKYKSQKEFFDDIQLIWNNCKLYNQEGSTIYQQAINMEKVSNSAKQHASTSKQANQNSVQQASSVPPSTSGIAGKQKKTEKQANLSILKKKIQKNKDGSSNVTGNTNLNSNTANNTTNQPITSSNPYYSKKERNVPPSKGDQQQQDKYANQQERKYAHISLRLNLAFKLKNASEDKLVNLFAMLAEKHPETLTNIENREQKLQMNITLLPDQIVQNMIAALEFKD